MEHSQQTPNQSKGFTLVVTLALMVLLTLLAVGLLSLSSVSLRGATHRSALADARANARLALMIALGELQKELGPDRAISATSEILASPPAKPNTTGVWESWWDFNPDAAPGYSVEKTKRFRRWLVSNADVTATRSPDFPTTPWTGNTVELVGKGTLGSTAAAASKVTAGLVPISNNGKVRGTYAWHVADESVKARVNLYRDPGQNGTLAQKRALLAGHRPDPSVLKGADGGPLNCFPNDLTANEFAKAMATTGKITDLDQAELLDQAKGKIKPLRNDITPYSLGVMSDVRGGGLKQDLSSVFEMGGATANTLPAEFTGKKLYQSTHGITGVSDPSWSALAGYYNSFRNLTSADTNPTYALKQGSTSINPVPDGFNPAPVIAKVDTIFSIVARPLTNMAFWISNPASDPVHLYDYMLNIVFTPVVTLHNPYNVNISFQKMEVSFKNIPVAFNFMFQSNGAGGFASKSVTPGTFEALNTMSLRTITGPEVLRTDRIYVMNIADWNDDNILSSSSGIKGPIVMKPGQTLICGPTVPVRYTAGPRTGQLTSFDNDTKSREFTVAFDWESDLINTIKARPVFTPGLGFELSAVAISHYRAPLAPHTTKLVNLPGRNYYPGGWGGQPFLLLRDAGATPKYADRQPGVTDQFYVEYKIQRPDWYTDYDINRNIFTMRCANASFSVTAKLQPTAADTLADYASLQFNYGDPYTNTYLPNAKPAVFHTANDNLNNIFNSRTYRYPPTGYLTGSQVAAPVGVPYSSQASYLHPIAIFSAYTRTSNGGVYETGKRTPQGIDSPQVNLLKDGRLAGKPYLFHNPSRSNFTMNLAVEKPAAQAYELNFQPFLSRGDFQDYMDVDASNRVPALTGNKTTSGIKSGSYLEVPSGPLQTLADFRRSNAMNTAYPPCFVQPVGNSLLHPLMSADKVIESDPAIASNTLLDHSILSNHALYDRFYFSTFATSGSTKPDAVFEQFMTGSAPLASQAFQPYLPAGKTVANARDELFSGGVPKDGAYKTAAEYQMIRGPFNVNSTSVQAWKAVLASMNKSAVATLWARNTALETNNATGAVVSAMSMVNGGPISGAVVDSAKIDNQRTNAWNGYRELNDTELETLATKIVAEVRDRGPFLSMSEFVNRQVGPAGARTLTGALEAAIAKAEINEKLSATSADSFLNQVPITATDVSDAKLYKYKTPEATTGNPAAGAPGWVNQGDLLRILEPAATVRGDTFVIRSYGDAKDDKGQVIARAYAEAVVQRVPEYVDPANRPSINVFTDPAASVANKTFGRRINVVSFRWLSENEI